MKNHINSDIDDIVEIYYHNFGQEKKIWELDNHKLGSEMKKLREEQGLDLEAFATIVGLRSYQLSNLEKGFDKWSKSLIYLYIQGLKDLESYDIPSLKQSCTCPD